MQTQHGLNTGNNILENDKISISQQMEKVKPAYFTEKTSYSASYGLHNAE